MYPCQSLPLHVWMVVLVWERILSFQWLSREKRKRKETEWHFVDSHLKMQAKGQGTPPGRWCHLYLENESLTWFSHPSVMATEKKQTTDGKKWSVPQLTFYFLLYKMTQCFQWTHSWGCSYQSCWYATVLWLFWNSDDLIHFHLASVKKKICIYIYIIYVYKWTWNDNMAVSLCCS